ncbi:MAG TPA: hypothetical protein VNH20_02105 [Candidatus Dormibacteraeota bacterium]|nr:hypothetical protein [Candidatus Dormibacteraeota bacterium]
MRKFMTRGLAVAVGAVAATGGGLAVASAAATPAPNPSSSAHPHLHRGQRIAGEVTSDSSSGGAMKAGELVLKTPNGTSVTLTLANRTKAWLYHGPGDKPTSESASAIPQHEVIVAYGRTVKGNHVAFRILDLGFTASQ